MAGFVPALAEFEIGLPGEESGGVERGAGHATEVEPAAEFFEESGGVAFDAFDHFAGMAGREAAPEAGNGKAVAIESEGFAEELLGGHGGGDEMSGLGVEDGQLADAVAGFGGEGTGDGDGVIEPAQAVEGVVGGVDGTEESFVGG